MNLRKQHIFNALSADNAGSNDLDEAFQNVRIDSRLISKGDIFIAIKGDNVDGHDFIGDAINRGASLVLSSKLIKHDSVCVVDDTVKSLGRIAEYLLSKIDKKCIGITGTNGKSTVTRLIASILKINKKTHQTYKNYNNQIGLPLSILQADDDTEYFVLELGASKIGDIRELSSIAKPNIVALLNVSPAHLETFGDIENILMTKEEIIEDQGYEKIVVLNKDDKYFERWNKKASRHRIVTISKFKDCDYKLVGQGNGKVIIKTPTNDIISVSTKYTEDYMLTNILFAAACALEAGARPSDVQKGIEGCILPDGRLTVCNGLNGSTILDSTYNANPESFKAAIDSLLKLHGEKWIIMGEMGELGDKSFYHHFDVVNYAKARGIQKILMIGKDGEEIKKTFENIIYLFNNMEDLIKYIKPMLKSDINILVKASRFMKFEIIVDAITEKKTSD